MEILYVLCSCPHSPCPVFNLSPGLSLLVAHLPRVHPLIAASFIFLSFTPHWLICLLSFSPSLPLSLPPSLALPLSLSLSPPPLPLLPPSLLTLPLPPPPPLSLSLSLSITLYHSLSLSLLSLCGRQGGYSGTELSDF